MTPWLWWLLLYRVKRFSLEYRKISIMASKLNARYLLILREVKSKTNCDSLSRFLRVFCQLRVFSSSFDWLIGWFACFVIGQGDNNNGCRFRAAVESMKSGNYFGFGFGSTAVWDWLRSQNCCVHGFVSVNNTQLKTALFPRLQRFFFYHLRQSCLLGLPQLYMLERQASLPGLGFFLGRFLLLYLHTSTKTITRTTTRAISAYRAAWSPASSSLSVFSFRVETGVNE